MSKSIPLSRQITDRNFLQATGFKFSVIRAPKLGFYGNALNVPGMVLGVANQPTYLKNIPRPGEILEFNDLRIRFLIDENLENYMEIQKWLRGIGFPESLSEIYEWQNSGPIKNNSNTEINLYSDGTLLILNGINNPILKVVFKDLFPTSLSNIEFDATQTDVEYLTADVTFKYSIYNIVPLDCC